MTSLDFSGWALLNGFPQRLLQAFAQKVTYSVFSLSEGEGSGGGDQ